MSNANQPADTRDWRNESSDERDDRNLAELLQELRVAGLGVQVLFGFLLALPFSARFDQLGPAQRGLYVSDLVLAAVATALLVGPVAYHRLVFRRHQKEHLVRIASAMAICGLVTVALAVSAAVVLIVSYVMPGAPTVVIGICVPLLFASLWFGLPVARRERVTPPPPSGGTAGSGPADG